MLSRGASDDAKRKVIQSLQAIEDRKNKIEPEYERVKSEYNELLSQGQNTQAMVLEAKQSMRALRRLHEKLENAKRKLRIAQKELEDDDEEKKKECKDDLKKCVSLMLNAMGAHSESYKRMMEAKVKSSGALINKEIATGQEITCRYVLIDLFERSGVE